MLTESAVETIAREETSRRIESGHSARLDIHHAGNMVQLVKAKGSNSWMLTAFDEYQAMEQVRGATHSVLRNSDPIRSRVGMGVPDTDSNVHVNDVDVDSDDSLRFKVTNQLLNSDNQRGNVLAIRRALAQALGKHNSKVSLLTRKQDMPEDAIRLLDMGVEGWFDLDTGKVELVAQNLTPERAV